MQKDRQTGRETGAKWLVRKQGHKQTIDMNNENIIYKKYTTN